MRFSESPLPSEGSLRRWVKTALIGALSALMLSVILLSWVPPVSRDALAHHLAIPKLYLKHGGMYEIPGIVFSYYPMNLDLLYVIPLYFHNDIVPKHIHFAFALLTGWLIFSYLKKRTDKLYALLGALFYLSLPLIVKLSITAYVDLGLIFFSTACLYYLLKWIENCFKLKYLIFSAVWCGLALGTKYNSLIVWFLVTLFVPFIYSRSTVAGASKQLKSIRYGVVFMLTALLIFSPWLVRNYVWTKNPFYPLYNHWFNPQTLVSTDRISENSTDDSEAGSTSRAQKPKGPLGHFSFRSIVFQETWWEIALVPIRIFFQGQDGTPKYFDGRLNPFLFFLPFLAFVRKKKDPPYLRTEKRIFCAFAVLFLLFAFFKTDMRIRYIAPIIPPLVILSMLGLYQLRFIFSNPDSEITRKIRIGLAGILSLAMISFNAAYILGQFRYVDPMSYIAGRIGRDEYIEKYRQEYPAIQFANKALPESARILSMFFGGRIYYSDREMLTDIHLFFNAVKGADSPDRISSRLHKSGITHLLIHYDLFNQWSAANLNDREKRVLGKFLQENAVGLFSENGYGLFRLHLHAF